MIYSQNYLENRSRLKTFWMWKRLANSTRLRLLQFSQPKAVTNLQKNDVAVHINWQRLGSALQPNASETGSQFDQLLKQGRFLHGWESAFRPTG